MAAMAWLPWLLVPGTVFGEPRAAGAIAVGTTFATPYYVQDTGRPGPTVVIIAGIHGNEPAGVKAAARICKWPIQRGKLVVLPRANPPALQAQQRGIPEVDDEVSNLNRNFPKVEQPGSPRGELAQAIWELVESHEPDWLLDLHEGYDFHQLNPRSVGSSILTFPTVEAVRASAIMLEAVNQAIEDNKYAFAPLGVPVDGSLARAAAEHLGSHAMIVETTTKDQDLSLRVRQQCLMVRRFLQHLQMLAPPQVQQDDPGHRVAASQNGDQATDVLSSGPSATK
jgi:predicted deacylase